MPTTQGCSKCNSIHSTVHSIALFPTGLTLIRISSDFWLHVQDTSNLFLGKHHDCSWINAATQIYFVSHGAQIQLPVWRIWINSPSMTSTWPTVPRAVGWKPFSSPFRMRCSSSYVWNSCFMPSSSTTCLAHSHLLSRMILRVNTN